MIPTLIHEDNYREQVACNDIEVKYCPTEVMAADILTKGLPKVRFEELTNHIGIKSI